MLSQRTQNHPGHRESTTGERRWRGTSELEDCRLIQATCGGDSAAFGGLVRKYRERLCNSMLLVCASFADAEDTTQEAFLRAYQKLGAFGGRSTFYTWLYRIALRTRISQNRRRSLNQSLELTRETCGDEPLDDTEALDERLLREERATKVRRALDRLSAEYREILVLREIDECGYGTIAELLRLPIGTVRSRLHRARLQLREQLERLLPTSDFRSAARMPNAN